MLGDQLVKSVASGSHVPSRLLTSLAQLDGSVRALVTSALLSA